MKEATEFILQCNSNSFIEQVIYSKENLDTSVLLNQPLLFCLAPESLEAGKIFFDNIRLLGKAENVALTLLLGTDQHTFLLSGVQLNDQIMIIARHAPEVSSETVSEVTDSMVSEEVEAFLQMPRPLPLMGEDQEQREVTVWDLLEEMSRLNNELINTKRELVRKNLELERLQQQLKNR